MNATIETLNSFLSFRLGDEFFAANVSQVLEILEIPKITKVPRSPAFMRGVVNLRGSVLPVVDTRIKFGLPAVEDTINSCILVLNIVLNGRELKIGAIVDSVQEVMEIEEESVQALPSVGSNYSSDFIAGMVKKEDQFIMMLDINLLFSSNEALALQSVMASEKN